MNKNHYFLIHFIELRPFFQVKVVIRFPLCRSTRAESIMTLVSEDGFYVALMLFQSYWDLEAIYVCEGDVSQFLQDQKCFEETSKMLTCTVTALKSLSIICIQVIPISSYNCNP